MKNTEQPFIHVSDNLALELINTQFTCHDETIDLLSNNEDVFHWAAEQGIELDKARENTSSSVDIQAVKQFRQSLKDLLLAHMQSQDLPKAELDIINEYLLDAPLQQKLSFAEQTSLEPLYKKLTIRQLLGKVAYETAQLLISPSGKHIKKCSNSKCILMFVDTSRAKKRRWCSMDRCGNRAKASTFYHSHK